MDSEVNSSYNSSNVKSSENKGFCLPTIIAIVLAGVSLIFSVSSIAKAHSVKEGLDPTVISNGTGTHIEKPEVAGGPDSTQQVASHVTPTPVISLKKHKENAMTSLLGSLIGNVILIAILFFLCKSGHNTIAWVLLLLPLILAILAVVVLVVTIKALEKKKEGYYPNFFSGNSYSYGPQQHRTYQPLGYMYNPIGRAIELTDHADKDQGAYSVQGDFRGIAGDRPGQPLNTFDSITGTRNSNVSYGIDGF